MLLNIFLTLYLLLLFRESEEIEYTKEFLIESSINPIHIYWVTDSEILVSDTKDSFLFDLGSREKENISQCENCIVGYDNGILFCEYVHREIQSEEEFSTTVTVRDINMNVLNRVELFPTVIPTVCKKELLVLKSAYPFLEQSMYLFRNGTLEEITVGKERLDFKGIPEYKNISIWKEKLILLDIQNLLYLYVRKSP